MPSFGVECVVGPVYRVACNGKRHLTLLRQTAIRLKTLTTYRLLHVKTPTKIHGLETGVVLMNRIIYLVGLVVIVVFILGYFGLR